MAEWTSWIMPQVLRLDLVPGIFITLTDRQRISEWDTTLDANYKNVRIHESVNLIPTEDELYGPYEAMLANMKARALKLWRTRLVDMAELSVKTLAALPDTGGAASGQAAAPDGDRAPELHFYADYGSSPANKYVISGYREAERAIRDMNGDVHTTQVALLRTAGGILDSGKARIFLHDADEDGNTDIYELKLGNDERSGKELKADHDFYGLWLAGSFLP